MGEQVEPIFRAIEFIEGHLHEDLTVAQIADATGYSLFHFMRKFNQMVHHTPYDYLMRRRLSEAAKTLVRSDLRIIDIAFDHGFKDQETFSRVFRRMFQMTPSQCRKQNGITARCLMAAKTIEDLMFINSSQFHAPRLEKLPEMELFGLMTRSTVEGDAYLETMDGIMEDLRSLAVLKPRSDLYSIWYRMDAQGQKSYQFTGAERTSIEEGSSLLVRSVVRAGRYLCMEITEGELALARSYLYSSWLPGAGLKEKDDTQMLRLNHDPDCVDRSFTIFIPVME